MPISASTYFYWRRKFKQPDKDRFLKDIIRYVWNNDQHLGVIRITKIIRDTFDLKVNHKRVYRLMKNLGIYGKGYHKIVRKYDSSKGPEGKRIKNKLNRQFKADRPHQKLVSDVTEFKVPATQEKVYLEPIMDLHNNEILSYAVTDKSPNLVFAIQPLIDLKDKFKNEPYQHIMHTDQGWQYRHNTWQKQLKKTHVTPSMSQRATCLDNACIESFFNKLKVEIGELRDYNFAKELKLAIKSWIAYYNNSRIQMKLGGLLSIFYRQQAA